MLVYPHYVVIIDQWYFGQFSERSVIKMKLILIQPAISGLQYYESQTTNFFLYIFRLSVVVVVLGLPLLVEPVILAQNYLTFLATSIDHVLSKKK